MSGTPRQLFYNGVRASITWLHEEARSMNDPHTAQILNNAAFHLGQAKPDPSLVNEDGTARSPQPIREDPNSFSIPSDRLDVEKLARVIDRFAMDTGFDAEGRAKAIKAAQAIRSFLLNEDAK